MKVLLFISTLVLIVSCGKYERPFISFKSPEKRLTEGTWGCTKAVDSAGNEFQVEDRITFSIDGTDSVMTRITNHYALKPYLPSSIAAPNEIVMDTLVGAWTWGFTLGDSPNKQIITTRFDASGRRHNRITVLSNKEFVYQDQTFDNTTYHYKKL